MNKLSKPEIVHRLERVGESIELTVWASEENSSEQLSVKEKEIYQFSCDKGQCWKDWFIPSGPNGFLNPLAILAGLRVKSAKCFCLCGVYDKQDRTAFRIGSAHNVRVEKDGTVSFFANDTRGYYDNNKGCVRLLIQRLV